MFSFRGSSEIYIVRKIWLLPQSNNEKYVILPVTDKHQISNRQINIKLTKRSSADL